MNAADPSPLSLATGLRDGLEEADLARRNRAYGDMIEASLNRDERAYLAAKIEFYAPKDTPR